jgi:hypothetical protein
MGSGGKGHTLNLSFKGRPLALTNMATALTSIVESMPFVSKNFRNVFDIRYPGASTALRF